MIINQRCASIREQAKSLTSTTLKPLFNDVVQELKVESNDDLLQEIVQCFDEVPGSTLTDISIINHELFIIIQDKLISIIKKWHSEHETLNKEEETIYLKTSQLLSKMVASTNAINIPVFKTWLLKLPYLEIIKICIQSIGTNGKHLNDPNLQSFGILLKALSDFQRPRPEIMDDTNLLLLLDPVRTCICSKYYLDSFLNLQLDSSTLSVKDDFLLVQCPFYFAGYKGKRREETSNALLDVMLSNYEQIFSKFIPMIHSWNHSIILPIHHITNVLTGTCNVKSCKMRLIKRLNIVNDILIILSADNICNEVKNTLSNAQSMLINSAIACLFNLTLEEDILAYIKEKNVTQAFLKLTNSQYDRIEVHAYMILACIMNEDDIKKLADPTKITAVFINFLKEAVDHPSQRCRGVSVAGLLTGLKALVQHDQIKEEIVDQKCMPLLVKCATKFNALALVRALETLWTMTFNVRAADILRKDDIFMTRIRSLLKSDQEAVSKCAEGIIWKLEKEAEFMAKEQEKIVQQQQILTEDIQTDTHVTLRRASLLVQEIVEVEPAKNRYDIMMSYSHSDKELCYKIHERLLMDKFHVWIDLENMFGSTMSAMASAIENSEFVLVCMSDFYKQSSYCQVEAEYAFKRQRNLIPLIMREKYRPDGWLGILSASKMYIDFTKTDFDTAYDKLIIEIRRYRSQQPSITKQSYIEHHDIPNEKTKIISNEQEQTPRKPIIINSTNAYSKILLERWTEQDVQEFLMNKNLSQMMPLCNDMDGCGLIELYKMCETNSDGTYRSLNTQLHEMNQKTLPITVYSRFLSELKKYIVVKTTQKKSFMCTIL